MRVFFVAFFGSIAGLSFSRYREFGLDFFFICSGSHKFPLLEKILPAAEPVPGFLSVSCCPALSERVLGHSNAAI